MKHELKTWVEFFEDILKGNKKFEIRKADRDFQVGDILVLKEFDNNTLEYSGREINKIVTWIMKGGKFGLEDGYVVMSIE